MKQPPNLLSILDDRLLELLKEIEQLPESVIEEDVAQLYETLQSIHLTRLNVEHNQ